MYYIYIIYTKGFLRSSALSSFHTSHPVVSCTYSSLGTSAVKKEFKENSLRI